MKFTAVKWEDLPLGRSTLGNSVAWYLADWGVAMLERLWGWQKAEYESAIHPGSRNGQQHPGPYEQSRTWQIDGSNYSSVFTTRWLLSRNCIQFGPHSTTKASINWNKFIGEEVLSQ